MKSTLAKRLVLGASGFLTVLFTGIGINVGYERPADRALWLSAAMAVALLLVAYACYAWGPEPDAASTDLANGDTRPQAPSAENPPSAE